jgi:ABC-type antimicrobial peptide transport system permease subunit
MTLGAKPRQIVAEVMGRAAWLVGTGTAAGLLLTMAANRALQSALFGVSPLDAATLAGAVGVLAVVAAVAAIVPTRRAARIDPLAAIRNE